MLKVARQEVEEFLDVCWAFETIPNDYSKVYMICPAFW